jgi:TPR repeat protein
MSDAIAFALSRLALAAALLTASFGAVAGFPEAIKALAAGDYATADKEMRPIAEGGDTRAQVLLARIYRDTRNPQRNATEAIAWFRRAADAGNAEAHYWVGVMHAAGDGTDKSMEQALQSWRQSAEAGHGPALGALAMAYASGSGVDKDMAEAVRWARLGAQKNDMHSQSVLGRAYLIGAGGLPRNVREFVNWTRRAALQGERAAQAILGRAYSEGLGVPQDYVQAHMWLNLAAARGSGGAGKQREELAGKMTSEQIAEAQKLARAWRPVRSRPIAVNVPSEKAGAATLRTGMGSGFFVDSAGHIITNHHVVNNCGEVRIPAHGETARVIAADARNDLALLGTGVAPERLPTFREGDDSALLGESVIVAGFPLGQVLAGGLNVTTGSVSALAGPRNNAAMLQITAPVQSGNSGGPVLDQRGQVIGVVVGKLNALRIAAYTGDVPQNVNFAINRSVVRTFLEANGVQLDTAPSATAAAATTEIADQARHYTVLLECWR